MTWRAKAGVAGALVVAACAGPTATRAPGSTPTATGAAGEAPSAAPGTPSAAADVAGAPPVVPAPAASSRIRCPEGRGDCDEDPGNGCETDLEDDPENCRFCGRSCRTHDGAAVGCFQSMCHIISCPRGKCDLDGRALNGCEGEWDKDHCAPTPPAHAPHYDF